MSWKEDSSIFSQHSSLPDDQLKPRPNVSAFIGYMYDEVIKGNVIGHKFSLAQWIELMVKMNEVFPEYNYQVK